MGGIMLRGLLFGLCTTLVIELLLALIWGIREMQELTFVLLANIVTNPIVVLLCYFCMYETDLPIGFVTLLLELWAVGVEALAYRWGKLKKPLLLSAGLNGISYLLGNAINYLL